jgi:phosphate acetyltransferase
MTDIVSMLRERARRAPARVVLPEGDDPRIVEAAARCRDAGVAEIVLLGAADTLQRIAADQGVSLEGLTTIDVARDPRKVILAQRFREARKSAAPTPAEALRELQDPLLFGTMLVQTGEADGLVAGARTSTARTIEPALLLRTMRPGLGPIASSFIMHLPDRPDVGAEGTLVFTDCGLNPEPSAAMLAQIAIAGARIAETLCGLEPRVALLSFSTLGSAEHARVDKVREALAQCRKRAPELVVDGELQADAAIVESVARLKAPQSPVAGAANVLVFPSLEAGNIAYKLVERLAGGRAIGPIFSGLNWPINDLSRGCSVDDVIDMVAITSIMARSSSRVESS